jgi:hypothetical protein
VYRRAGLELLQWTTLLMSAIQALGSLLKRKQLHDVVFPLQEVHLPIDLKYVGLKSDLSVCMSCSIGYSIFDVPHSNLTSMQTHQGAYFSAAATRLWRQIVSYKHAEALCRSVRHDIGLIEMASSTWPDTSSD